MLNGLLIASGLALVARVGRDSPPLRLSRPTARASATASALPAVSRQPRPGPSRQSGHDETKGPIPGRDARPQSGH